MVHSEETMPLLRLTRTSVEKLACAGRQEEYFDTKLTGFGVRVNRNSKSYFAQGKISYPDGSRRKFNETIGRVGIMAFDDAWDAAKGILEDAAKGISPADRRREAQVAAAEDEARRITLRQVYYLYIATRKKMKESTKKGYLESLERNVPEWFDRPIREVTGKMIVQKHAELGARAPGQADSLMRIIRALFNYVIDSEEEDSVPIVSRNPVRKLTVLDAWYRLGRRTTYIHPEDLPAWFAAVLELDEFSRNYILLVLFSGARRTEAAALKVGDADFVRNVCVFRETKTGKVLEVPVARYVMERIKAMLPARGPTLKATDFVFPSLGRRKSKSGHIEDLRAQYKKVIERSGVQFTPHDLRRSFESYAEILRVPVFTKKRLCNHALPKDVTEGYIQFPLEDLRNVVEEVADYILTSAGQNKKAGRGKKR